MPANRQYKSFKIVVTSPDGVQEFGCEVGSGSHSPQSLAQWKKSKFNTWPEATQVAITGYIGDEHRDLAEVKQGSKINGQPDDTITFDWTVNPPVIIPTSST